MFDSGQVEATDDSGGGRQLFYVMLIVFSDVRTSLGNPEAPPALLDPSAATGFPKRWIS